MLSFETDGMMHRPRDSQTAQRDGSLPARQLFGFVKKHNVPVFRTRNVSVPFPVAGSSSKSSGGFALPRLDQAQSRLVKSGGVVNKTETLTNIKELSSDPTSQACKDNDAEKFRCLPYLPAGDISSKIPTVVDNSSTKMATKIPHQQEQADGSAQQLKKEPKMNSSDTAQVQPSPNKTELNKDDGKTVQSDKKTEPKKTVEELEEEAKQRNEAHLVLFQKTQLLPRKTEDGTVYTDDFLNHMRDLLATYGRFLKYPLKIRQDGRQCDAASLHASGALAILCDIVAEELKTKASFVQDSQAAKNHFAILRSALTLLVNNSDCSKTVTYFVRDHETILPLILASLQDWCSRHISSELQVQEETCLRLCMSILHNLGMREDNASRLRALGTSNVLMPYLESPQSGIKLSAYATLADIVTEEEADNLSASPKLAKFLLNRLRKALAEEGHRCEGWSVTELVRAVRRLSRNDANKRLMTELGAIPLLTQGIQSTFEDEKCGCMETVWVLSFDKQNVTEIVKCEDLMDIVVKGATSYSEPVAYRHAAQGILFQLRQELAKMDKYSHLGEGVFRKNSSTTEATAKMEVKHIMLSYQWADQAIIKRIRDYLRSRGFKVWMDIDNMGGSTLQAMADAIEDSFVVLLAMSQKYKDSPNCRAEAEYAYQQRKTIIPVITQRDYRPDGWLGMILGAKLFYDFSGKYPFEARIDQLLRAVQELQGQGDIGDGGEAEHKAISDVDTNIQHTVNNHGVTGHGARPINTAKIKNWSIADVKDWLKKFNLDGTQLETLTGKEIVFLSDLRLEAPEFFYSTLEKKLHIQTLTGLISFTDALDDLPVE